MAVEQQLIPAAASMHLVKYTGGRSSTNLPSALSKSQAELRVLPVQKEPLIEQPGIFQCFSCNQ
jgi:hypothetical protein